MSGRTSLTNLLQSLAFNDAMPFESKCTASTIAALAADVIIAAPPLVCSVLGTGIATLSFGLLAGSITFCFMTSAFWKPGAFDVLPSPRSILRRQLRSNFNIQTHMFEHIHITERACVGKVEFGGVVAGAGSGTVTTTFRVGSEGTGAIEINDAADRKTDGAE